MPLHVLHKAFVFGVFALAAHMHFPHDALNAFRTVHGAHGVRWANALLFIFPGFHSIRSACCNGTTTPTFAWSHLHKSHPRICTTLRIVSPRLCLCLFWNTNTQLTRKLHQKHSTRKPPCVGKSWKHYARANGTTVYRALCVPEQVAERTDWHAWRRLWRVVRSGFPSGGAGRTRAPMLQLERTHSRE